jgi:hypothetical protein
VQLTASQADTVQAAIEHTLNQVREGDEFDGLKDVSVESMLRAYAMTAYTGLGEHAATEITAMFAKGDGHVNTLTDVDALLGTGYIESFRYQHQTLLPAPSSNGTGESKCR